MTASNAVATISVAPRKVSTRVLEESLPKRIAKCLYGDLQRGRLEASYSIGLELAGFVLPRSHETAAIDELRVNIKSALEELLPVRGIFRYTVTKPTITHEQEELIISVVFTRL